MALPRCSQQQGVVAVQGRAFAVQLIVAAMLALGAAGAIGDQCAKGQLAQRILCVGPTGEHGQDLFDRPSAISDDGNLTDAGGLMSYETEPDHPIREVWPMMSDRVLDGTPVGDIPISIPAR